MKRWWTSQAAHEILGQLRHVMVVSVNHQWLHGRRSCSQKNETVVTVAVEHVNTITTGFFFSASQASVSRWSALYATTSPGSRLNAVDLADQNAVYYSFKRKTVKWWRKVAFWLLETAVVNSYILYMKTVLVPISHIVFHRLLIESLASRHIVSAPPHLHVGRPCKHSHPDSDVPETQPAATYGPTHATELCCVPCCRETK